MRVVVQRVVSATVRRVDGIGAAEARVGAAEVRSAAAEARTAAEARIGAGLLLLAGFRADDDTATLEWMAEKCLGLRIFADDQGAMNRSVGEIQGALLVVPNFTLYGDAHKGRRPSFTDAAPPAIAGPLFEQFVGALRRGPVPIATGFFQAGMHVESINDGPVTLVLERDAARDAARGTIPPRV